MLRLIWDKRAREALAVEAHKLVASRMARLAMCSDEDLTGQPETSEERHVLGGVRVQCVVFHEIAGEGEERFIVHVWGEGFVAGGWLLAADGFAIRQGRREQLPASEVGS